MTEQRTFQERAALRKIAGDAEQRRDTQQTRRWSEEDAREQRKIDQDAM